jgi:putative transposase
MPRGARHAPGGYVYHALNRAVGRARLFRKQADYAAFERVLAEALDEHPIRLLGWCLMPNHWHFVLWPEKDGQLTAFLRWLTHTHTMRWHTHYHTAGTGHLYQGRYKSFPIQEDDHFYAVLRYVERNPLRAGLVGRAELWRWSSLWQRLSPKALLRDRLAPWPVPEPGDWLERVNEAQTEGEVAAVRLSVARGAPFGAAPWQGETARRLGLESTLRPRGRPKKPEGPPAERERRPQA